MRLVGADCLVLADAWDKTHSSAPELMGQKFQQFEAPTRFGLRRFCTLHVRAWKENPTGETEADDDFPGNTRAQRAWFREMFERAHVEHESHFIDASNELTLRAASRGNSSLATTAPRRTVPGRR